MIVRACEQELTTRENMRQGKGTVSLQSLVKELPGNARLFSKITLKPNCSIGFHVHENETELFYFMEGSGTARDDGETVAISAGDAMSTPSGHGHSVENTGDSDLVILAVIIKDNAL